MLYSTSLNIDCSHTLRQDVSCRPCVRACRSYHSFISFIHMLRQRKAFQKAFWKLFGKVFGSISWKFKQVYFGRLSEGIILDNLNKLYVYKYTTS